MSLTMNQKCLLRIIFVCLKREDKMLLEFEMQMDLSAAHYYKCNQN